MAQSLSRIHIHIIFATKHRHKVILKKDKARIYQYLGGIIKSLQCKPIQIGGMEDHIHILCSISSTITIADLAQKIKSKSSKWIKSLGKHYENFTWQRGYGCFSVSENGKSPLIDYILQQEQHHKKVSFKEEYLDLLDNHGIKYDVQFLWAE